MKQSEYTTSTGRKIYVFREVYDYAHQLNLLKWALKQSFKFNPGNEELLLTSKSEMILSSNPSIGPDMCREMLRIDTLDSVRDVLGKRNLTRHWINADISKASTHFHADAFSEGCLSLLYYLNCKWDVSWDGYTVWATDDLKDVEHMEYPEPGKLVIFDSLIPHKPMAAAVSSPSFRYTMNTVWK